MLAARFGIVLMRSCCQLKIRSTVASLLVASYGLLEVPELIGSTLSSGSWVFEATSKSTFFLGYGSGPCGVEGDLQRSLQLRMVALLVGHLGVIEEVASKVSTSSSRSTQVSFVT
jgi:hypothetical protein